MNGAQLQDRFSRGLGAAARVTGMPHDLYRPRGARWPLGGENRVLRLSAAFDLGDPGYRRPRGYDRAFRGTFDADCTAVGDYMRGPAGVLFIVMLPQLQRPLCVRTNVMLDILRPRGPEAVGLNGYGGVREPRLSTVLEGWPALMTASGGDAPGALPDDGGLSGWAVLLPPTPLPIAGSDLVRDEVGRRFLIRSAERSEQGWRLQVREAGI